MTSRSSVLEGYSSRFIASEVNTTWLCPIVITLKLTFKCYRSTKRNLWLTSQDRVIPTLQPIWMKCYCRIFKLDYFHLSSFYLSLSLSLLFKLKMWHSTDYIVELSFKLISVDQSLVIGLEDWGFVTRHLSSVQTVERSELIGINYSELTVFSFASSRRNCRFCCGALVGRWYCMIVIHLVLWQ
jgi:hypothetical protein